MGTARSTLRERPPDDPIVSGVKTRQVHAGISPEFLLLRLPDLSICLPIC
jgi:hypothetical protein